MSLGARGERIAARTLKRGGYRILARNFTCPAGELDLIALDGDTVVFVEVKTRTSDQSADPEANVHYHKKRQLARTAKYYLAMTGAADRPCRFDVVAVVLAPRHKPVIEHFIDAFHAVPA